MDQVRKYSREWLTQNGTQSQKQAAKKLNGTKNKEYMDFVKLEPENFTGSKEQVKTKFRELEQKEDVPSKNMAYVINHYGGIDNIFDLLDADENETITEEEIAGFAIADTAEFAKEDDTIFSAKDLRTVYENVIGAEGASVTHEGNKDIYTYKDGTVTTIEKDDNGQITKKFVTSKKDKENYQTEYDYKKSQKTDTITDAKGRERYSATDLPGRVNDKTVTTKYNDQSKTKIITTKTAGTKTVDSYDKSGQKVSSNKTLTYQSDGVLGNTEQKSIGDCWVLSGARALSETTNGAKIIKNSIKQNNDGSVTVTLKGVNRSYTFTPDEIGAHDYVDTSKEYSDGDIDMNLLEMAITKYRSELVPKNAGKGSMKKASVADPINGGYLNEAMDIISGKKSSYKENSVSIDLFLERKQKKVEQYALTVEFKTAAPNVGKIVSSHAYNISRVTEDTVYVRNPWDSSVEIPYPRESFKNNAKGIAFLDMGAS